MADNSRYLHGIEILEIDVGGRTISTPATSIIGIIGTAPGCNKDKLPVNKPILITSVSDIEKLGMGEVGTIPMALRAIYYQANTLCVVIRIEDAVNEKGEADTEGTIKNAAGDMATFTGVYALLHAEVETSYKPKILICPYLNGLTIDGLKPNAIVTNLTDVADKLRGITILDGTNTTKEDAIAYAKNLSSSRLYLVDPKVIPTFDTGDLNPKTVSSSAYAAGIIAKKMQKMDFGGAQVIQK